MHTPAAPPQDPTPYQAPPASGDQQLLEFAKDDDGQRRNGRRRWAWLLGHAQTHGSPTTREQSGPELRRRQLQDWNEWNLFRLPGGADGFVLIHAALFVAILWGYGQVVLETSTGRWLAWAVACGGLFAIIAHGGFLLAGRPEFRSPISIFLLGAIGMTSVLQAIQLVRRASTATAGRAA